MEHKAGFKPAEDIQQSQQPVTTVIKATSHKYNMQCLIAESVVICQITAGNGQRT